MCAYYVVEYTYRKTIAKQRRKRDKRSKEKKKKLFLVFLRIIYESMFEKEENFDFKSTAIRSM